MIKLNIVLFLKKNNNFYIICDYVFLLKQNGTNLGDFPNYTFITKMLN